MSRTVPHQSDLFATAFAGSDSASAPPPVIPADPIAELHQMLALVRSADRLPWPDLQAAMAWEYRSLFLARQSGPEGQRLVSAIMDESERLFAAQEREQVATAS